MTLKGQTRIRFGHSFSIVNNLDAGLSCIRYQNMYFCGFCINRVFYQFLDDRRRTLNHLSGSNLAVSYTHLLEELKAHYQRGGLGDMKVKGFLNNIMQETLEPIRNRRKEFEKDIPAIYDMLKKGCEAARETAAATLDDVRRAMKINYFDDAELIAEQVKKFSAE